VAAADLQGASGYALLAGMQSGFAEAIGYTDAAGLADLVKLVSVGGVPINPPSADPPIGRRHRRLVADLALLPSAVAASLSLARSLVVSDCEFQVRSVSIEDSQVAALQANVEAAAADGSLVQVPWQLNFFSSDFRYKELKCSLLSKT
jgi:hypothetical protein